MDLLEKLPWQEFLFWLVALMTALSAISVVVTQNIVRAATWLLFTLGGVSGLFFLLAADFVAATQLIVYVGGTLVLVVFGVMLTAQGPFISMKTGVAEWALSVVVGLLFLGILVASLFSGDWQVSKDLPLVNPAYSMNSITLGESLLGIDDATPDGNLTGLPKGKDRQGQEIAQVSLPRTKASYVFPFEIVSVHLLVVLIGAAYLARAKRRKE